MTMVTLLFCCHHISAQTDTTKSVFEIGLNGHAGRLVKIHGEYPENDISTLLECQLSWKTRGRKTWQRDYRFPSTALSLIYGQFGNQQILGQVFAVIPQLRFEKWKNNTRWSWRAGLGIAGFNKPFDAIENPRNLVIGSRFTNMTMLRLEMSRPLTKKMRYNIGLSYTHCSDAHIAVPNIGANLLAITAGISFCKQPEGLMLYSARKRLHEGAQKWSMGSHLIFGIHEFPGTIRPVDGPKYFVYGTSIYATKQLTRKGLMTLGLNYHYYTAYHDYILSQEIYPPNVDAKKKSQNLVMYLGYEWNYGRFSFIIQGGINLYDPFLRALNEVPDLPKHGPLHQYTANKIGYKYYLLNKHKMENSPVRPYVTVAVKTNGGTADFLEFGLGLELVRK